MYQPGDVVIHPAHGAAKVVGIESKDVGDGDMEFLVLEPLFFDMKVYIPQNTAKASGLRQPVKKGHFRKVVTTLKKESKRNTENWQRRFRSYNKKIQSGDLCQVAEVVSSLDRKNRQKGLSTTENILLERAFNILASEYVCVTNTDKDSAFDFFNKALMSNTPKPADDSDN